MKKTALFASLLSFYSLAFSASSGPQQAPEAQAPNQQVPAIDLPLVLLAIRGECPLAPKKSRRSLVARVNRLNPRKLFEPGKPEDIDLEDEVLSGHFDKKVRSNDKP